MKILWILALLLLALGVAGCVLFLVPMGDGEPILRRCCWFGGRPHHHADGSRTPAVILKTLSMAEADFRANDRDGDKICQFWRADVAGLYAPGPKGGEDIKLIELSTAAADDRPVTELSRVAAKSPRGGYWFRAIRHVDEDPKSPDPDRFAFCGFPASPSAGKYIFIVDETNTIYFAEAKGRRWIDVYPTSEELKQWVKFY